MIDITPEDFDELFGLAAEPMFWRKVYGDDPPPAPAPHPDAVWNEFEEVWQESDAALRARIRRSLEEHGA